MEPSERYAFDLLGFCIRQCVLPPARVASLNALIDAAQARLGPERFFVSPADRFKFLHTSAHLRGDGAAHTPESLLTLRCAGGGLPFLELMAEGVGLARALCGEEDVRLDHAMGIQMAAGAGPQPEEGLHAGRRAFRGKAFYEYHNGRLYNGEVT